MGGLNVSRFVPILLIVLMLMPVFPGSSASPNDDRVDVEIELEMSYIEMAVSTQDYTERTVQGWVEMVKKPPGENLEVHLSVKQHGQYVLGTYVAPPSLFFFYVGTQYFNVSIRFQEDTPPGFEYLVDVDAEVESHLGGDLDTFHLTVVTVPELDGEASMFVQPKGAMPGDSTEGIVDITNTGTMYAQYQISISLDENGVIETAGFDNKLEMTPNWVEKVPFDIKISESASPGEYDIVMTLEVVHDDGSTAIVDTFDVHIEVMKETSDTALPYTAIMVVSVLILVFVIAILLRRRS